MFIITTEDISYPTSNVLEFNNLPLLTFAITFIHTLGTAFIKESLLKQLPLGTNGEFSYGSYHNRTTCRSQDPFRRPQTIFEIQGIVYEALSRNLTVRALGSVHTDTDVVCTYGIPIDMRNIQFVTLNDDFTATLGAGIELTDALDQLQKHGRSLANLPSHGGITIGGVLGCASHGSSLRHPNIVDTIVGLTIVDGTGEIQNITQPEELNSFKANLGFLGVIYSATVSTVPLFKIRMHNYPESDNLLFNGQLLRMARQHDLFQFWWFPSDRSVVISEGDFISPIHEGNAITNFIPSIDKNFITTIRAIMEMQQELKNLNGLRMIQALTKVSLYGYTPRKPVIFSEDGVTLKNPAVGYGHKLMTNRCTGNSCPWDLYPINSGLAMDIRETVKIAETIKSILKESPAEFPMIGFYFRFATASNGLMTIESGRETVHIEWIEACRLDPFNTPRAGLGAHQAIMQALIHHHDGRPHWAKNGPHWFTGEYFDRRGSNLYKFRNEMKRFDPFGIFLNDFGRRILGTSNFIPWDPREKYCGLNDNCACKQDSDCGSDSTRVKCVKVYGFNVCQKLETTDVIKYLNNEILNNALSDI